MPPINVIRKELDGYVDILLGREPCPIEAGTITLHEFASVALGRALEIQKNIHRSEVDGRVSSRKDGPGNNWYRFRTGELRDYIELYRDAVGLGESRRAAAKMEYDQQGSI